MGKSAEAASADPNAVRADKEHYIIPLPRLLALVKDVTLSEKDIARASEKTSSTERTLDGLKFSKIAMLLERCSNDRDGDDRITLQRLSHSIREIGGALSQSLANTVRVSMNAANGTMDLSNYLIEADEYFRNLTPPDRSNVRNLRDDRPQIFYSQDQISSPLDGLDEDPKDLSRQISSFHQGLKELMSDIRKVRPAEKLVQTPGESPFPINNSYDF